jgi:hypothetical protein
MDSMMDAGSSYVGTTDTKTRLDAQRRLAELTGLRLPGAFVPEGEALWDIGQQAKAKLEHAIDELPYFKDGIAALKDRIRAEDAKDYSGVPIQRLWMQTNTARPTFGVTDDTKLTGLGYTRVGFGQIIDAIKPNSARSLANNLLLIDRPKVRADVFNHFAERAYERNKDPVTLRTICEPKSGLRTLRAVVSAQHSLESGDDLAVIGAMETQLADSLAKAKLRVTRDLEKTYLETLWPAMKREIRTGDIVYIGVRVRNSETKQGALKIKPYVLQDRCYNFTTAESTGGDEEVVIRHVGDLGRKLVDTLMRCLKRVDPFIKAFGDAYQAPLPATRGEILQRLQRAYELPDGFIKATEESWNEQAVVHQSSGETLADLVNAMTKASQEQSMDDSVVTGRIAGTLITRGFAALETKKAGVA